MLGIDEAVSNFMTSEGSSLLGILVCCDGFVVGATYFNWGSSIGWLGHSIFGRLCCFL